MAPPIVRNSGKEVHTGAHGNLWKAQCLETQGYQEWQAEYHLGHLF